MGMTDKFPYKESPYIVVPAVLEQPQFISFREAWYRKFDDLRSLSKLTRTPGTGYRPPLSDARAYHPDLQSSNPLARPYFKYEEHTRVIDFVPYMGRPSRGGAARIGCRCQCRFRLFVTAWEC